METGKNIFDLSTKRLDVLEFVLGIFLIFLAGYLWLTYFFNMKPDSIIDKHSYDILYNIIVGLFLFGAFFSIVGYMQMADNYNMEKTLLQIKTIESLEKLKKLTLEDLKLPKGAISKFKKYIKNKLKDLIEGFE